MCSKLQEAWTVDAHRGILVFMATVSTSPPRIDPVGEALHYLRMSGAFYCRSEFTAPFGLDMPPFPDTLMFHIMITGRCWLEVPGEEPQCLQPGDLGLVPHGRGHRLTSDPGAEGVQLFDLPREQISERYELLRHGGGGAPTTMLCGAVTFDHPAAAQLVRLLPNLVHVDAWSASEAQWLQSTLRFIASEAQQLRPGGETIITRLCDVLVIQAIRSWMSNAPGARTGWLGALQDEQIGRAIALVHRDAEHSWTVAALAAQAGMSRSAFAARFAALVGEPPMRYVTRWRMHVALSWLRESDATLVDVAIRLGYQSEAAFSRAFKRFTGMSPGAARRATPAAA
ncbi:MAG: AraC family transcriptional regulator [Myxococcales bacterium]|nr:AraC family transcriptional regulator [Myxococcales bacterium]MDH3483421.1 AraC family transcriptional regulator [Myxococcales bacterium]